MIKEMERLNKNLIANTKPEAKPEANVNNIVFWQDYRITVLSDRLFRVEKNEDRKYRDCATQVVWYRNMPEQKFEVILSDRKAIIKTERCSLILLPNRRDCRIGIDGKILRINNDKNLSGTCRTLDKCDGAYCYNELYNGDRETKTKIRLESGVCSRSGVAVFDDVNSLSLGEDGTILDERGTGSDEYVFAYGSDYRDAVKALISICGDVPVLPKYALGNWWSRYHAYTDKEYLSLMKQFEADKIPLTVATIDMDWHYSDHVVEEKNITEIAGQKEDPNDTVYPLGWTGYSWNKRLFPDYRSFLGKLHEMDLMVTLNVHPSDGVRYWEDMYPEMAEAMGIDPSSRRRIPFEITDPKFVCNYFDILHVPYEKAGVDFWWIDWQQGTNTKIRGLDPLWALNHYHFLHANSENRRSVILSRYSGIGSHRYPIGFSGDTFVSWETLRFLPYFTATSSNIGYSWWSHDIGGHLLGEQNNELYLRHVQFGVFSPINRLHCCNSPSTTKDPNVYKNGVGKIAADWLRFRHSMIPFLYSWSYRSNRNREMLIEPMYYEYKTEKAYRQKGEYLFGRNLLVIPITRHTGKDGYARVRGWLPKGVWTDVFTDDIYTVTEEEGRSVSLMRKLDSIPVLAKEGTIFPLSLDEGNGVDNPQKLEINVFKGNGSFELFESDGNRTDGRSNLTVFRSEVTETDDKIVQILDIGSEGDVSFLPKTRIFRIRFRNVFDKNPVVSVNGRKHDADEMSDAAVMDIAYESGTACRVEISYKKSDFMEIYRRKALRILQESEGIYEQKDRLYYALESAGNREDVIAAIDASPVQNHVKEKLKEIL